VCGLEVEEASREGGGRVFEPRRPRSGLTVHIKNVRLIEDGWLAGSWGPSHKKDYFFYLFLAF
jgi:hypothetical protein